MPEVISDKPLEVWEQVHGFENYEVSDLGRVRNKRGHILRDRFKTPMRYRCVRLYGHVVKEAKISTLVLETFVGPRPEGMVVRHLNGIAQDDRLANLEWATHSDNILDKIKHGTNAFNDRLVKITHVETGEEFIGRQRPLSRQLNLNQGSIWQSCNKGWVTKGYRCEYLMTEED
jgi:hypothetical protein